MKTAMIKLAASMTVALILTVLCTPAQAASVEEKKFCAIVQGVASFAMETHQYEKMTLLEVEAFIEPKFANNPHFLTSLLSLIRSAYSIPIYETNSNKDAYIKQFGELAFNHCIKKQPPTR